MSDKSSSMLGHNAADMLVSSMTARAAGCVRNTPRRLRARVPSPLSSLPRGFFREPRAGSSAPPPPPVDEVPAWLFACGDITEAQAARIAAAINGALGHRAVTVSHHHHLGDCSDSHESPSSYFACARVHGRTLGLRDECLPALEMWSTAACWRAGRRVSGGRDDGAGSGGGRPGAYRACNGSEDGKRRRRHRHARHARRIASCAA